MKDKKITVTDKRLRNLERPFPVILVNLTWEDIKEKGGIKNIVREWKYSDGVLFSWWYRVDLAPSKIVTTVYWVVGGVVRYRSNLDRVELDKKIQFPNKTRPTFGRVWLNLSNFEALKPDQRVPVKRFAGWKYVNPDKLL